MPENKLSTLRENLIKDGYELPELSEFEKQLSDSATRNTFWSNLKADGYELPDFETFSSTILPAQPSGPSEKVRTAVSATRAAYKKTPALLENEDQKRLYSGYLMQQGFTKDEALSIISEGTRPEKKKTFTINTSDKTASGKRVDELFRQYESEQQKLDELSNRVANKDKAMNATRSPSGFPLMANVFVSEEEMARSKRNAELELKSAKANAAKTYEELYDYATKASDQIIDSYGLESLIKAQERTGKKIPDLDAIYEVSKNIAETVGVPKDGAVYRQMVNIMRARVGFKINEPQYNEAFKKTFKKKYGESLDEAQRKSLEAYMAKSEPISAVVQKRNQALIGVGSQITAERNEKASVLAGEYSASAKQIQDQINSDPEIAAFADQSWKEIVAGLQEQVSSGSMGVKYAEDILSSETTKDMVNAKIRKFAEDKYGQQFKQAYDSYMQRSAEMNSWYNQRFTSEQKQINAMAEKEVRAAMEKAKKDFKIDPELEAKMKSAYEIAVGEVNKANEFRDYFYDKMSNDVYNFYNSFVSGLGAGIKGISEYVGAPEGVDFGLKIEQEYAGSAPELKSFSDLIDGTKFWNSFGNLLGRMSPTVAASAAVAGATGMSGLPTSLSMLTTGLSAWMVESADIAGTMKYDVFEATGDMSKAVDAERKSIHSQIAIMPAYAFEGLPFFSKALSGIKNVPLRIGAGAGIELATETAQEIPQNAFERLIREDKDLSDIYTQLATDYREGEMGKTMLNLLPITLLGGVGPAYQGGKEIVAKRMAKSYAAKNDLSDVSSSNAAQFLFDVYQRKGKNFASAMVELLHTNGTLDKVGMEQMKQKIADFEVVGSVHKKLGLPKKDKTANLVSYRLFDDYLTAHRAAQAESDPLVKPTLEARAREAEKKWRSVMTGEKRSDMYVMTLPSGEAFVYTQDEVFDAVQKPEIRKQIMSGDITIQYDSDSNAGAKAIIDLIETFEIDEFTKAQQEIIDSMPYIPQLGYVDQIEQRMSNAEDITEQEMDEVLVGLYQQLDYIYENHYDTDAGKALAKAVFDRIEKLQGYEFTTGERTKLVTETRPATGASAAVQQDFGIINGIGRPTAPGSPARIVSITEENGKPSSGTVRITDDGDVIIDPVSGSPIVLGNARFVNRTVELYEPAVFDKNGDPVSVTITVRGTRDDVKSRAITVSTKDGFTADELWDLLIALQKKQVGPVPQQQWDTVVREEKEKYYVNEGKEKPKATEQAKQKPVAPPTQEQILDDINNGRVVTFTYGSRAEVPIELSGKISSEGEVNGKKEVRVTISQSEADYILNNNAIQEQTAGEVPVQPEAAAGQEVAEGTPQAEPEAAPKEGKKEVDPIRKLISNVAKAWSSAGIRVEMIETEEEYNKIKGGQLSGSEGVFVSDEGVVYFNMPRLTKEWGKTIVFHEGTHPALNIIRNTNPKLYAKLRGAIGYFSRTDASIRDYVSQLETEHKDKPWKVEDEAITEIIARIGSGKINVADLPQKWRNAIIDFINSALKLIGVKARLSNTNEAEFVRFAKQVTDALRTGTDMASVVGQDNVSRFQAEESAQKRSLVPDSEKRTEVRSSLVQLSNQGVLVSPDGKMKMSESEIDAQMALMDAMAGVWKRTTGNDNFYSTFIGDIKKGDITSLKQSGGLLFQDGSVEKAPVSAVTLSVFYLPQFKQMEGKQVNPQSIKDLMKSRGKQIEKNLISYVLGLDKYAGQKKISYDEFRSDVELFTMRLERIRTTSYASYGSDNLGSNEDYGTAETIIFNSPINHGEYGHFSSAFNINNISDVEWEVRQLGDTNTWAAVDKSMPQGTTQENLHMYVGTAGTKAHVEEWVNERKSGSGAFAINVGLFGHIRRWMRDDVFHLVEMQSDFFQKQSADSLLISDETMKSIREEQSGYRSGRFDTALDKLLVAHDMYIDPSGFSDAKIILKNGNGEVVEVVSWPMLALQYGSEQKSESILAGIVHNAKPSEFKENAIGAVRNANIDIDSYILGERKRKINEIKNSSSDYLSQFAASEKIHEIRIFREAVRLAAEEGASVVRFPTPRTLAVIEGYINNGEGNAPYEILNGDSDGLTAGDKIEYGGDEYLVVDSDNTTITVAPADEAYITDIGEYIDNEVDYKLGEARSSFNFNHPNGLTREAFESGDLNSEDWWWEANGAVYKYFKKNEDESVVTWDDIDNDVQDYIYDDYNTRSLDDLFYDTYYPLDNSTVILYHGRSSAIITLMQPDQYSPSEEAEEDFDKSKLDARYQTVVTKYEELNAYILKNRPGSKIVRDDNEVSWIEFELTKEDRENPVIAFQNEGDNIKGAIDLPLSSKANIYLFDGADISTLAHEMTGHVGQVFLSKLAEVDSGFARDYDTVKKWARVKDDYWSRWSHEKFARAFERYLRDGIAPTQQLKSVFSKMAEWLKGIYRIITGSSIDVEITPEVRRVFDRMLGGGDGPQFSSTPRLAPNGNPSNLNPVQYDQVRTPEFKEWFGDWENDPASSSKVVDENGEPLVVYHGARKAGFDTFDDSMGRKGSDAPAGTAFFTSNRDMARSYSGSNKTVDEFSSEPLIERGGVYEVFLNIRSDYAVDFGGANWDGFLYGKYELYDDNSGSTEIFDSIDEAIAYAEENDISKEYIREDPYIGQSTNQFVEEAKRYGADGAVMYGVIDYGSMGYISEDPSTVYVTFDSNQIKSANANTGSFSTTDNRIQFSSIERLAPNDKPSNLNEVQWNQVRTPEFKAWFGDWENDPANSSKVVDENGEPLVVYHGTTHDFDAFSKRKAFLESDMGAGFYFTDTPSESSQHYALEGEDLKARIQKLTDVIHDWEGTESYEEAEQRARAMLNGGMPNMIPVFLNIKNPVEINRFDPTYFNFEEAYDEESEEYGEPTGRLLEVIDAIKNIPEGIFLDFEPKIVVSDILDYAIDRGGVTAPELEQLIKESQGVMYATDPETTTNELVSGEIFRRVMSDVGFDGIFDGDVYGKFNMEGTQPRTVHYIAFMPNQIKSAISNTGQFSTTDDRIQFSRNRRVPTDQKLHGMLTMNEQNAADHNRRKRGFMRALQAGLADTMESYMREVRKLGPNGAVIAAMANNMGGTASYANNMIDHYVHPIFDGLTHRKNVEFNNNKYSKHQIFDMVLLNLRIIAISEKIENKFSEFMSERASYRAAMKDFSKRELNIEKLEKSLSSLKPASQQYIDTQNKIAAEKTARDAAKLKYQQHQAPMDLAKEYLDANDVLVYDKKSDTYTLKDRKFPQGATKQSAMDQLNQLEDQLPILYADMMNRAGKYRDVFRLLVNDMYRAGIINENAKNELNRYFYVPMKNIVYLIEDLHASTGNAFPGMTGELIQKLKAGSEENVSVAFRDLLNFAIANTYRVIERNKTTSRMAEEAQNNPDNGIISIPEVVGMDRYGNPEYAPSDPQNAKVYYKENGIRKAIEMDRVLAEQYLGLNTTVKLGDPKLLGKLTFSTLFKEITTSANPAFGIYQTVIDIPQAILASNAYKTTAGGLLGIAWSDIKLLLNRKTKYDPLFDEASKYGALTTFSRHDAENDYTSLNDTEYMGMLERARTPLAKAYKRYLDKVTSINTTFENLTRLAVYEKSRNNLIKEFEKKNGYRPTGRDLDDIKYLAAEQARNILNYSRGGEYIKEYNKAFAYLNVAFQAPYSILKEAKKHPVRFAMKFIEIAAYWNIAQILPYMLLDDDDRDRWVNFKNRLSDYERDNYIHIYNFGGLDEENIKESFWRFPKPSFLKPIINAIESGSLTILTDGKFRNRKAWDYFTSAMSASPVGPSVMSSIPIMNSIMKYVFNFDTFRMERVVRDDQNKPNYLEGIEDRNVSTFLKSFALWQKESGMFNEPMTISPKRADAALRSLIGDYTRNPMTAIPVLAMEELTGMEDTRAGKSVPKEDRKDFVQKLKEATGLPQRFVTRIPTKSEEFYKKISENARKRYEFKMSVRYDVENIIDAAGSEAVPSEELRKYLISNYERFEGDNVIDQDYIRKTIVDAVKYSTKYRKVADASDLVRSVAFEQSSDNKFELLKIELRNTPARYKEDILHDLMEVGAIDQNLGNLLRKEYGIDMKKLNSNFKLRRSVSPEVYEQKRVDGAITINPEK